MNKKGFTLVELIAVIVILSLLALISNSSVVNVVRNSKSDLYNTQLKLIESAAETWGDENYDKLPNEGECKYLTLANLKNYGLVEKEIINPKTNNEFSDNLYIKITSKINSSGMLKTTYKVDDNVNGCAEALPPICTLASDSEKKRFEAGAKYNCKVKDVMEPEYQNGYTFYVLSQEKDGRINLILERNVYYNSLTGVSGFSDEDNKGWIQWASSSDYGCTDVDSNCPNNNKGPITAIQYLYNATKNWTNVPPLNYIYEDRKSQEITASDIGYTSFVSKDGISTLTSLTGTKVIIGSDAAPLRARIPVKSEVGAANGTNEYLYENLDKIDGNPDGEKWYGIEGKQPTNNINGIYGYWILSANPSNFLHAFCVDYRGGVFGDGVDLNDGNGVRPVITLFDYQIR